MSIKFKMNDSIKNGLWNRWKTSQTEKSCEECLVGNLKSDKVKKEVDDQWDNESTTKIKKVKG